MNRRRCVMKHLTRRSVTTGMLAAVTAIPAVGLAVVARSDPLERIKHHTASLAQAMRGAAKGLGMSTHFVNFSAEVTPASTEGLIATVATLHNQGATEIHLMLSTPGGSVMHGFTIYNVLRSIPVNLHTYNMGNVDSIGNVIFLAGSHRFACPHSTFMFHGVGFDLVGSIRLDDKLLREKLDSISADHKRIASVIEQYSSLDERQVVQLFEEARTKDAAWAQSVGLIEAVREPEIAAGIPVHSLVFSR